jgi:hypothetical protein
VDRHSPAWRPRHRRGSAAGDAGVLPFVPGHHTFSTSPVGPAAGDSRQLVDLASLLFGFGYVTGYLAVFQQDILVAWAVLTPVLLWLVHVSSPLYVPRLIAMQGQQTAIVVGANELGQRIARTINDDPFEIRKVVGFFDDRSEERLALTGTAPLAGNLKSVAAYVKAARVSIIFVTLPVSSQPRILALFEDLGTPPLPSTMRPTSSCMTSYRHAWTPSATCRSWPYVKPRSRVPAASSRGWRTC